MAGGEQPLPGRPRRPPYQSYAQIFFACHGAHKQKILSCLLENRSIIVHRPVRIQVYLWKSTRTFLRSEVGAHDYDRDEWDHVYLGLGKYLP